MTLNWFEIEKFMVKNRFLLYIQQELAGELL